MGESESVLSVSEFNNTSNSFAFTPPYRVTTTTNA